jgi:phospholipid/cholesterol/gamma-HCH transport system permease protein
MYIPDAVTFVGKTGDAALKRWHVVRNLAAVIWGVLCLVPIPRTWSRTVREQAAKQIMFTGIDAMRLTLLIALLAGIPIVVQAQLWLTRFGQSEMLGPLLVGVIIREVAPLLVSFIVIARSGTAIATELANMRVRSEVEVLDAQGIDPVVFLVMPRVMGVMLSVFCLTLFFIVVCLSSGYLFGALVGVAKEQPAVFAKDVLLSLTPGDFINLCARTLVSGLVTGAICSIEGLSASGVVTDVPKAVTRGVVRSIIAVLIISAVASVFMYL